MSEMTLAEKGEQDIFDGMYRISNDGRLYSVRSHKYIKPNTDKSGYLYYVISINGDRRTLKAHRLVAMAYIPNPHNKPTVNHKNGIRSDNRVCNLEWATSLEQMADPLTRANIMRIAERTDYRAMGALRNFGRKRVVVYQGDELLGIYESLKQASDKYGLNYSKASECANGRRKTTGGKRLCYI